MNHEKTLYIALVLVVEYLIGSILLFNVQSLFYSYKYDLIDGVSIALTLVCCVVFVLIPFVFYWIYKDSTKDY